jgi:hypothetical protein
MAKNNPGTEIHGSGRHVVTSPGSVPVAFDSREVADRVASQVQKSAVVNRADYKSTMHK